MTSLVSVVMPIFNGARFLAGAIESIRSQTFTDWELLCLDDGSTDDSLKIIDAYAKIDARIRAVAMPHRGIVSTLNSGVTLCRGEFVARQDADDLSLPQRFEIQLLRLRRQTNLAVLGGAYQSIDNDGRIWKTQIPPESPSEVAMALQHSNCMAHSAVMFRRQALGSFAGPYRSYFPLAEDYDLWMRVAKTHRIGNCPDVVLQYRRDLRQPRPERTVQQTLSTMAVQATHGQSGDTAVETIFATESVNRETLIRAGLSPGQIKEACRRSLLAEARLAVRHGFQSQATNLVREAEKYQPRHEGFLKRLDYCWRRMRVRFA